MSAATIATMAPKKSEYTPGTHPNSLENLTYHKGRPLAYDEPKKRREASVTQTGWDGLKQVAIEAGCTGISDLLEKLGRREIELKLPE